LAIFSQRIDYSTFHGGCQVLWQKNLKFF
jgi:hypothetical protein